MKKMMVMVKMSMHEGSNIEEKSALAIHQYNSHCVLWTLLSPIPAIKLQE